VLLLDARILKSVGLSGEECEGLGSCAFICLLLSLVDLLLKRLGFLLVGKRQPHGTAFDLEGMEEGAVLVVGEGVEYLLVPDDAAVCLADVDELDPEGIANEVVCQHGRALQAGVGPFGRTRVCDVQASDSNGQDSV
jgi:hypothetical protein